MTASESSAEKPAFPLQRIIRFGVVVSTILLAVNAFVCATWAFFTETPGWLWWQILPGSLPVIFIATTILGFRYANPLIRFLYTISAAWLGALNFAFLASMLCWIAGGIDWMTGWQLPRYDLAADLAVIALAVTVYGLINAAWIRTIRIDIKLANLPEAWEGRTVALVTDLHLGHLSRPRFLQRVIDRLRTLQSEAVFVSGDMFDGSTTELDYLVANWRNFSAPKGVFFVEGNHDEFDDRRLYDEAVRRVGIRVLNNEMITIDGLQVVGVHDAEATDPVQLRAILNRIQLDPRRASILLAHRPENLEIVEEAGISLQVSGHTHGGQVWPWTMLVSQIYRRFAHGLNRLGKLQVYTSYGVGTWGPPLRVGTHSEITLIRLFNLPAE